MKGYGPYIFTLVTTSLTCGNWCKLKEYSSGESVPLTLGQPLFYGGNYKTTTS